MSNSNSAVKPAQIEKKTLTPVIVETAKAIETPKAIMEVIRVTAEDRIQKMENFQILSKKFLHLKEKKEQFKKFLLSRDGQKEKLILNNGEGFNFEVNNSVVVGKVAELLEKELESLLSNSEKEVREFEV